MSQVREDLEGAVAVLDAHGWCQGSYQKMDGRVCAKGAVRATVLGHSGSVFIEDKGHLQRVIDAEAALSAAVPSDVVTPHEQNCRIAFYNDLDSTSAEDVKLMFKRAIEACEEDA